MNWYFLMPVVALAVVILSDWTAILALIGFAGVYALLLWLADAVLGDKGRLK